MLINASGSRTQMDLGALKILNDCAKGHKVIGICDGEFVVCEVHIPKSTPLNKIDEVVRMTLSSQFKN